MNLYLKVFFVLLALKFFGELFLDLLNRANIKKNANEIPSAWAGLIDQETYEKSVKYSLAKNNFSIFSIVYDCLFLGLIIFYGFLPYLFYTLSDYFSISIAGQTLTLISMGIITSLFSIPLDLWSQFKLEEEFGFNNCTFKLWLTDKVKGLIIAFAVGFPIGYLVLKFYDSFQQTWWIWAFVTILSFQLLMLILYPKLILPIFNKLTALPEGELKDRLISLAERSGFQASTIQVMDGSKRSGHSNAFFTGFGKYRHIILYDTLVEQLEPVELEAVLAHEIGHCKKGHIPKLIIASTISMFIGLAVLAWFVEQTAFFEAFGFSSTIGSERVVPAMILFSMLTGLIAFWIKPLTARFSRKYEYEADAFAAKVMSGSGALINSLRKLHKKNLSNLTPHPLYSAFHYSHPTLLEREDALKKLYP